VIAWKVYQQAQISAGRRQPIVIHSPIEGQPRFANREHLVPSKPLSCRAIHIFIFNQSAIPQTVTFLDIQIKWPRLKKFHLYELGGCIEIPPNSGGNLPIYFCNPDWFDLSNDSLKALNMEWQPLKCLIFIRTQTLSGKKLRFLGMSELLTYYTSP